MTSEVNELCFHPLFGHKYAFFWFVCLFVCLFVFFFFRQIVFKLHFFFSQYVAYSSKASLSCDIYCDLRQLMDILQIVCNICCDSAIVCNINCDFAIISSFSHYFGFLGQFTAFSLVTWDLLYIFLLQRLRSVYLFRYFIYRSLLRTIAKTPVQRIMWKERKN